MVDGFNPDILPVKVPAPGPRALFIEVTMDEAITYEQTAADIPETNELNLLPDRVRLAPFDCIKPDIVADIKGIIMIQR